MNDLNLSDEEREHVKKLCAAASVAEVARRLCVGKDSLLRVLAEQPIQRGTVLLLRAALKDAVDVKEGE